MKTGKTMILAAVAAGWIGMGMNASAAWATEDHCSDILSRGIFNTYSLSDNEKLSKQFHSWLCTSEFKTHSDAMNAGIGIGVPVYGVPVKIDGTFSRDQRDAWKKDNCQSEDRSMSSERALQIAMSNVSTAIVDAWTFCMKGEQDAQREGLSCSMRTTVDQVLISVKYVPRYDADARSAPIVTSVPELSGAHCAKLMTTEPVAAPQPARGRRRNAPAPLPTIPVDMLGKGSPIPVQGYTLVCARDGKEDEGRPEVRFTLNTDRGVCTTEASPASDNPVVFEGSQTFSSDVVIKANRVIFKRGARVRIENGSTLEIFAKKAIFEQDVKIDGHGAQGPQGPKGFSPPGDWTTDDRGAYDGANGDCSQNYNHFDRGGQGGVGGQGGQGATILIHASVTGSIDYNVDGGPGGPGGPAGDGRVHIYHGDAWRCPNNGSGPAGPVGPKGRLSITPSMN